MRKWAKWKTKELRRVGPHEQIVMDAACLLPCDTYTAGECIQLATEALFGGYGYWPPDEQTAAIRKQWEWVKGS